VAGIEEVATIQAIDDVVPATSTWSMTALALGVLTAGTWTLRGRVCVHG
jgi:hypothetical protein